ncbi:hypothetical protein L195_g058994, partial [Trifolium pratense]
GRKESNLMVESLCYKTTSSRYYDDDDPDTKFKFITEFDKNKRIPQIPSLIITQTTEVTWRNFIACEHHKKKLNTSSSSGADRRSICASASSSQRQRSYSRPLGQEQSRYDGFF